MKYSKRGSGPALLKSLVGHKGKECVFWPFARNPDGYGVATLGGVTTLASRAMCILAHGEPPTSGHQAAHSCGNGNLGCINPNCLRWATYAENNADKIVHGTMNWGERHGIAKLKADQVLAIVADPRSQYEIAAEYGCRQTSISNIKRGVTWSHLTGIKRKAA